MLIWLTQLGLSAAVPLAGFTFLGIWLHRSLSFGKWALLLCVVLGILSGARGFWDALKTMETMAKDPKERESPPTSFSDHQ